MSLSDRIDKLIKYYGLNNESLGRMIKVSGSTVRFLRTGKQDNPGMEIILKILTCYPEISADWLLLGEGEMILKGKDYNNNGQLHQFNEPTSPNNYNTPCTKEACRKRIAELEDDKARLKDHNDLLSRKIKDITAEKGDSPPGKRVKGGVEKLGKTGTTD